MIHPSEQEERTVKVWYKATEGCFTIVCNTGQNITINVKKSDLKEPPSTRNIWERIMINSWRGGLCLKDLRFDEEIGPWKEVLQKLDSCFFGVFKDSIEIVGPDEDPHGFVEF